METKANDIIRNNEYKISKRKINEESKNNSNNIIINNNNKLIDSQEFFFNYRNDNDFNLINNLETKPINKKYINEYNNRINNIKYYDLKNSVNSIDSNKMREISMEENEIQKQIKYEEKMLNELKEQKRKLINEDKKRREMILLEINNNKKEIKNKQEEINEILNECKIEKNKLKKNVLNLENNYNIQNNDLQYKDSESNYYKEYLENIRKRNEIINKKSKEIIERKINKENKKEEKEISSSYKKLKNYNIYSHSVYNSHNKRMKYNCSCPNEPSLKEKIKKSINWSVKRKKEKINKINKVNLYSYFKLNEKEKNFNENKAKNNKCKYLTPNGQYRENKTDYSKDSNITQIYKVLSSNENNNYMTQTRFYRSKINPDELLSNYAKGKALEYNMNRSYYKNKDIFQDLNNSKDYFDNYKINKSATNLMNLIDNKTYQDNYFNYSNNLFSEDIKRLSNYKFNSFLEKGKAMSNTKFVEIKNNKDRNINNKKYICGNCFKKMIH